MSAAQSEAAGACELVLPHDAKGSDGLDQLKEPAGDGLHSHLHVLHFDARAGDLDDQVVKDFVDEHIARRAARLNPVDVIR